MLCFTLSLANNKAQQHVRGAKEKHSFFFTPIVEEEILYTFSLHGFAWSRKPFFYHHSFNALCFSRTHARRPEKNAHASIARRNIVCSHGFGAHAGEAGTHDETQHTIPPSNTPVEREATRQILSLPTSTVVLYVVLGGDTTRWCGVWGYKNNVGFFSRGEGGGGGGEEGGFNDERAS